MKLRDYIRQANDARKRAQAAGNKDLVAAYILLPISVATEICRKEDLRGHDIEQLREDLVGAGNLALVEAAATYDPSKGHFGAYAQMLVRQRVRLALERWIYGGAIREVRHLYRVKEAVARRKGQGQPVVAEEVAQEVGLPVERVQALINLLKRALYLDAPLGDDGEDTHARWIPDERADVEGQALENVVAEERRELERAVKLLPSHTAAAIGLVTGFRSFETASLGDVLRAHGEGVQSVARTQVRKAFQRGQADARKLGFEPGDATGPARDSGKLPTPTAFARTNAKQRRDRAADIWRSLASRWGPAAGMDAAG